MCQRAKRNITSEMGLDHRKKIQCNIRILNHHHIIEFLNQRDQQKKIRVLLFFEERSIKTERR